MASLYEEHLRQNYWEHLEAEARKAGLDVEDFRLGKTASMTPDREVPIVVNNQVKSCLGEGIQQHLAAGRRAYLGLEWSFRYPYSVRIRAPPGSVWLWLHIMRFFVFSLILDWHGRSN